MSLLLKRCEYECGLKNTYITKTMRSFDVPTRLKRAFVSLRKHDNVLFLCLVRFTHFLVNALSLIIFSLSLSLSHTLTLSLSLLVFCLEVETSMKPTASDSIRSIFRFSSEWYIVFKRVFVAAINEEINTLRYEVD